MTSTDALVICLDCSLVFDTEDYLCPGCDSPNTTWMTSEEQAQVDSYLKACSNRPD